MNMIKKLFLPISWTLLLHLVPIAIYNFVVSVDAFPGLLLLSTGATHGTRHKVPSQTKIYDSHAYLLGSFHVTQNENRCRQGFSPFEKPTLIMQTKTQNSGPSVEEEEESISDVDTRVLQSLLNDSKFDFQTEEGVRKLLARGTVKKTVEAVGSDAFANTDRILRSDDDSSEFSSTVIKKLTETKLWQALQMKSSNVLESLGIWVANKVEQDFKVLAALGIFAWDRAVRDVARALPEAKQSIRKTSRLFLSNSSSFGEIEFAQWRQEEAEILRRRGEGGFQLNQEFQSVTKEVFDIMRGNGRLTSSSSTNEAGRALRTIAPAGTSNVAERQRRAFVRSQQLQRQRSDITNVAGSVIDTAWELRSELQAERNAPGYRSEPIRKTISAVAATTSNLMRQAAVEARLAASKRKELRVLQQMETKALITDTFDNQSYHSTEMSPQNRKVTVNVDETVANRDDARERLQDVLDRVQYDLDDISDRINQCIQEPALTWLQNAPSAAKTSTATLRDIVTKMILIRNEVDTQIIQPFTINNAVARFENLHGLQVALNDLFDVTSKKISKDVGYNLLTFVFYGTVNCEQPTTSDGSFFLSFDTVRTKLHTLVCHIQQQHNNESTRGRTVNVDSDSLNDDEASALESRWIYNNFEGMSYFATPLSNRMEKQSTELSGATNPGRNTSVLDEVTVRVERNIPEPSANSDFVSRIDPYIYSDQSRDQTDVSTVAFEDSDSYVATVVVELLSDEEYNENVRGKTKEVKAVSDEQFEKDGAQERKVNILALATLRSLDVILFLVEKIFTVGVPGTLLLVRTVVERLEVAQNEQRPAALKKPDGWLAYNKLKSNARGRY